MSSILPSPQLLLAAANIVRARLGLAPLVREQPRQRAPLAFHRAPMRLIQPPDAPAAAPQPAKQAPGPPTEPIGSVEAPQAMVTLPSSPAPATAAEEDLPEWLEQAASPGGYFPDAGEHRSRFR